jgi:hypothetical protein
MYGYGYKFKYNDMKVWRIVDCVSERSWYGSMDARMMERMMDE